MITTNELKVEECKVVCNPDNEHCWILVGNSNDNLWWSKRLKMTEGHPVSVEFDPQYVLKREEERQDIVGFYHTHPHMMASPSSRDHRTMGAWACCFGKPLVCCIAGADGLRAYWYIDDELAPIEGLVKKVGNFVVGVIPEECLSEE
jgi:proteasome lid subunit RPN8/RPN11